MLWERDLRGFIKCKTCDIQTFGYVMDAETIENAFSKHFIVNNSPYAWVVETGEHPTIHNWHLHLPNEPMAVLKTEAEFQSIVSSVTERNK